MEQGGMQRKCSKEQKYSCTVTLAKVLMPHLEMPAYPAEYGMLVIKPRSRYSGDEELAAIGVGTSIGHTKGEGPIVPQAAIKLILELTAPD